MLGHKKNQTLVIYVPYINSVKNFLNSCMKFGKSYK